MHKLIQIGLLLSLSGGTALWCDTVFTSSYSFETAVQNNTQQLENYSTLSGGTIISNGQTIDGITYSQFNLTGGATSGYITSAYNSLSGQSLGANHLAAASGAQYFFGTEGVTIQFASPVTALGVLFNVDLNSGSFGFSTPISSAFTSSTTYDQSTFVFAGLVASTPFTSATISSVGAQAVYNIPAIISVAAPVATPEPSSWLLSTAGILVLGFAYLRKFSGINHSK